LLNGEDPYSNKPSNTILAKREKVNFGLIFLLKSSKSTYNIDQSQELMTHARINNKKGRERERDLSKTRAKGAMTAVATAYR
jgi:hypothetical protein